MPILVRAPINTSATLTPAYHRLYYQLTSNHRQPTVLTDEGYAKVRRKAGGTYRTNTAVHILGDDLRTIANKLCAKVRITGDELWVPLEYILTPGSGTGGWVKDTTRHEKEIAAGIMQHIEQYGNAKTGAIDIVLDGKVAKDISWAWQAPSQQHAVKADLILYHTKNHGPLNANGQGNIFLSLKEKGGPERIRQYSGITELGAGHAIAAHREVKEFEEVVLQTWLEAKQAKPGIAALPYTLWKPIDDDRLKLLAVCGPETRPGKYSLEAVHYFCQGGAIFTSSGSKSNPRHVLTFSEHMVHRDKLVAWFNSHRDYMPVLAAMVQPGRDAKIGNHSVRSVRLGIWPWAKVKRVLLKKEVGNLKSMQLELKGQEKRQLTLWNEAMKKARRQGQPEIPFEEWLESKKKRRTA